MGRKKVMILLLWEKNFEYKNSIFSSDVCYDLSLWWHLPNWDIAFKQFKIVKIPKKILLSVFCSYNIYSQGTNVLYTLVYICLQSCTGVVSCLLPFMGHMTHLHHFGFISIVITLHRCIIYVQGPFFNADSTVISIYQLD
jgi:hypothetical protein